MKNQTVYTLEAVYEYLDNLPETAEVFQIPGSLADHFIIFHGFAVEVFNEKYINPWASGIVRHVYRKRIPASVYEFIDNAAEAGYLPDLAADEIKIRLDNFRDQIAAEAAAATVAETFRK